MKQREDLKSITIYDNGNLFNQNKAYTLTLEAEYYEALETEITVQGEEKDVPASEPMISKDEDGQTYLVSFGTQTNFVGWKNKSNLDHCKWNSLYRSRLVWHVRESV